MKSVTLTDVDEQIREDDARKWDTLVERDQMRFADGRLRLPRSCQGNEGVCEAEKGLQLTSWATSQMCQRLGIPSAYFRRCPAPLQDAQVNHWLHEVPETESESNQSSQRNQSDKWLLRAKGNTLRGVLSERYAKLSNRDILDCLMPLVTEARFEADWFAVTEESLHLRLFDPRLSREVLPGDRVMAGLHIGNSEVGKRAITVDALVYRLVCKNGLVRLVKGKSLLHHRHVGLTKAELNAGLGSAIQDALIQSSGFMERLTQATREPVTDMEKMLVTIASEGGLSIKTVEMVKAALGDERVSQRETVFGLVNALTHTAQRLSPDERYALEVLAGKVLEGGNIGESGVIGKGGHRKEPQTPIAPPVLPSPILSSGPSGPSVPALPAYSANPSGYTERNDSKNLSLFG